MLRRGVLNLELGAGYLLEKVSQLIGRVSLGFAGIGSDDYDSSRRAVL